ncbi:MAG TPA: sugar ABC transporter ATP-binding protein [Gemmatimonadota bacterium]|nr:sugar ABC transporter ATP-binding protein [Gemmatimonadota bacterium]
MAPPLMSDRSVDSTLSEADAVLRMEGIRKQFPGVVALEDVDLTVRGGEVHVLLGENGAGKSTLMKILSGAHRKDSGRIVVAGHEVEIGGPRHARELGIGIIYQELTLVPDLSAAENVFLGREPHRFPGLVDRAVMIERAQRILDGLGAGFDAATPVRALTLAQRQLVEVARALSLDARVLVMDEPTSALTERETRALFSAIRRLTSRGVAVVFISHRLDEIFEIGDRVTVLRDGRHVATQEVASADRRELVRLMANREIDEQVPKHSPQRGEELLRVEGLSRRGVLEDVSFSVHAGEVVGFAGLLGSGRTDVAHAVFGLDKIDAGRVLVRGKPVRLGSPRDAIRARIGLLTEDRKKQGLVLQLSVRENLVLPVLGSVSRFGVVSRRREREKASRYARDLRIKTPSLEQAVLNLSGGNQQKVVLGKWLACQVDILILDEPTRGIDVGAKQEVYLLMNRLIAEGVGIVLISSELPEIVGLSDRVMVMRGGRVVGEFTAPGITQEAVLACAVGA